MNRDSVSSSNLRSIGYDQQTQTLEIEFVNGWVYQYYGVTEHMHDEIMRAPSKGQFFSQYIRNFYPYSRVA